MSYLLTVPYCDDAKKYRDNFDAEVDLCRQCIAYNKSLEYKPVEGCYDGEYKQGKPLDLSVFPEDVRNEADDNWGEVIDFSVEEMLDMPVIGEESMEQDIVQGSETHDHEFDYESFVVTEKDLDCIDIDDLY